jgi:hypothetical protein
MGHRRQANKRMQPTALPRVFLLPVSFVQMSSSASSIVSAVRRLMRGTLALMSVAALKM